MARLTRRLAALALAFAVLIWPLAWALDRGFGQEVVLVSPIPEATVAINRQLWTAGEPVAEIYGVPSEGPIRVLFVDETRLVRPTEAPGLVLLKVDKQAGENPLQARTLWFLTLRVALGAALTALVLAVVAWRLSRRVTA